MVLSAGVKHALHYRTPQIFLSLQLIVYLMFIVQNLYRLKKTAILQQVKSAVIKTTPLEYTHCKSYCDSSIHQVSFSHVLYFD